MRLPAVLAVPLLLALAGAPGAPAVISVRPGDTLTSIAATHHTDLATLRALNRMGGRADLILAGQQLLVPAPPPPPVRRTYPPEVVAAVARDRVTASRRPTPSPAKVRALVVRTAKAARVDPALALAVAYQESGFQQQVVSDADAIGTMQVLPSTAAWLAGTVLHRRIDLFKAEDNVLAGVALLQQLLLAAPLDQAVAGYYQGLGSVRARGMLPDTRSYVTSVLGLRARFG